VWQRIGVLTAPRDDVTGNLERILRRDRSDRPGQEIRAETFRYQAPPYAWEMRGKCGFFTDFAYSS
jgi:hypothetical protein